MLELFFIFGVLLILYCILCVKFWNRREPRITSLELAEIKSSINFFLKKKQQQAKKKLIIKISVIRPGSSLERKFNCLDLPEMTKTKFKGTSLPGDLRKILQIFFFDLKILI